MSRSQDARIVLSNGAEFHRAEERIREYCALEVYRDIGFRGGYDDRHNVTNVVTRDDLESANNFYAQLGPLDRQRILRNARIPQMLAAVGDDELGELTDEGWEGVKAAVRPLLSEFLSIRNVTLAKTMKVLHLKRPHLFPVLDSFVVKFLTGNDMENNRFSEDELLQIGMSSLETSRADITSNRAAFNELQARLSDLPTPLAVVRLYDILCRTEQKWVKDDNQGAKYGTASRSLDQSAPQAEAAPSPISEPPANAGGSLIEHAPPGEIRTIKEFRLIVGRAEGVIVVTGTNPPRAHEPLCPLLTDDRFKENVVLSERKSAKYYWRASLLEARREFGAVSCKRCRPT